ncbi:MAG: ferritin-like domain-containing protein [Ilumatobacteraceae bacterium]|nr:ferritin-like domain-containing protein [Ilumatobacteraceae bacterium]
MSEINFYTAGSLLADKEVLGIAELEIIYQLECSGEMFYNLLADRVDNAEAAALLRKNAIEEKGHARRIARAIEIKLGHPWLPTAEREKILDIPLPDALDATMFLAVVQGEINGDVGYQMWADAEANEEVARLLRLNGREETIHAGRAQQVADILAR